MGCLGQLPRSHYLRRTVTRGIEVANEINHKAAFSVLEALVNETVPMPNHQDPNAIRDCFAELQDYIRQQAKKDGQDSDLVPFV